MSVCALSSDGRRGRGQRALSVNKNSFTGWVQKNLEGLTFPKRLTKQGGCSDRETPAGVAMLYLQNKTFCSRSCASVGSKKIRKWNINLSSNQNRLSSDTLSPKLFCMIFLHSFISSALNVPSSPSKMFGGGNSMTFFKTTGNEVGPPGVDASVMRIDSPDIFSPNINVV